MQQTTDLREKLMQPSMYKQTVYTGLGIKRKGSIVQSLFREGNCFEFAKQ